MFQVSSRSCIVIFKVIITCEVISINEGSSEGIHSVYERIYEGINLRTFSLVRVSTGFHSSVFSIAQLAHLILDEALANTLKVKVAII